jgi:hypothetical protein
MDSNKTGLLYETRRKRVQESYDLRVRARIFVSRTSDGDIRI